MIGIYQIICIKNNKIYIGSSTNINKRFLQHKNLLNNNKHFNKYLQNAWNKYSQNEFKFSIIEICKNEKLLEKELFYIEKFNTLDNKFGFNISLPSEFYNRSKTYSVIDPDGNESIVTNLEKFSLENNLEKSGLHKVANGKSRRYKGWLCKHINDSWECWDKNNLRSNKSGKYNGSWKITFNNNSNIVIESLNKFCKDNNYSLGTIYELRQGKRKKHKDIIKVEKCE